MIGHHEGVSTAGRFRRFDSWTRQRWFASAILGAAAALVSIAALTAIAGGSVHLVGLLETGIIAVAVVVLMRGAKALRLRRRTP
jgi:hypothetical protein